MINHNSVSRQANPWPFFAVALGLSFLFWIPLTFLSQNPYGFPLILIYVADGLGLAVAGIILIFTYADAAYRRDYWERVFDYRRISGRWILIVLFTIPAITALAMLVTWMMGGKIPTFGSVDGLLKNPLSLIQFTVFILLFGPVPEELGWRGYALDGLQNRMSALSAVWC